MEVKFQIKHQSKRISLFFVAIVVLFSSVLFIDKVLADGQQPTVESDESLVSIYDRGVERSIVTKARTVAEALKLADIEVNQSQDVVEPALDSAIDAKKFNVNIYRARPITIVDGLMRKTITTAQQTPELIAQSADITLHKEDKVELDKTSNLAVDGADTLMTINRALPVNLTLYGKKMTVRTQAKTVAELLKEKNITIKSDDVLLVDQSAAIYPNMTIELWRNGKQTVTMDEEIAFKTETISDANKTTDYREVKTRGENGKKTVTYEIEMNGGREVARQAIASVVTKEAKNQVEIVGTKINLPAGSHTDWMAAAGISPNDYGYVNYLVSKESGWRVNASNNSGAYGLPQALPGRKMASAGADWETNPITQLKWMNGYVKGRYGSWANAVSHSKSRGWY